MRDVPVDQRFVDIRGSARSADGSVALETDASGQLRSLYLADFAMDDGPDRLAATIADRHRVAMAQVTAEIEKVALSAPSSRSETVDVAADLSSAGGYVPSHLRRGEV